MSTGRAVWTLFTTIASIVIVVLVIQSCDRTARNLGSGLHNAAGQLQNAAGQIQQAYDQQTTALHRAQAQLVKHRQQALDGKPCKVGHYKGTIIVESMTAAHPGHADCI